jgi:hypothetical protein
VQIWYFWPGTAVTGSAAVRGEEEGEGEEDPRPIVTTSSPAASKSPAAAKGQRRRAIRLFIETTVPRAPSHQGWMQRSSSRHRYLTLRSHGLQPSCHMTSQRVSVIQEAPF